VTRSRLLVTGASGQLGTAIVRTFRDLAVVAPARASLDITDAVAVRRAVEAARPDVIVNCAAYNDVDGAESAPIEALRTNAFAVRSLARVAAEQRAALVHYSSDFVFDGTAVEPYREEARPAPRSTYAASKLLGEWFALDVPAAYVLRVESLFGTPPGWSGRRGTLETLAARLEEGRDVRAFTDRIVSPSYIADVAAATRHLLESGAPPGVYHCVNTGQASWYEVACELARLLRVPARVAPVSVNEVALTAARPRYCALSPQKLVATGFAMPSWREALQRWIAGRREPAA
jgi:dTDP-4-dehydrorhamnose reductase